MRRNWIGLCVVGCAVLLAACGTVPVQAPTQERESRQERRGKEEPKPQTSVLVENDVSEPVLVEEPAPDPVSPFERAVGRRAISGNTVLVQLDSGETREVRLIAIKAPEQDERFFWTSKETLDAFIRNREVFLERDGQSEDRFHRQLRHLFTIDEKTGELIYVNGALVWQGLAFLTQWTAQCKYAEQLLQKENAARSAKRRIWRAHAQNGRGSTISSSRVSHCAKLFFLVHSLNYARLSFL